MDLLYKYFYQIQLSPKSAFDFPLHSQRLLVNVNFFFFPQGFVQEDSLLAICPATMSSLSISSTIKRITSICWSTCSSIYYDTSCKLTNPHGNKFRSWMVMVKKSLANSTWKSHLSKPKWCPHDNQNNYFDCSTWALNFIFKKKLEKPETMWSYSSS